jgi:hypothetical protein
VQVAHPGFGTLPLCRELYSQLLDLLTLGLAGPAGALTGSSLMPDIFDPYLLHTALLCTTLWPLLLSVPLLPPAPLAPISASRHCNTPPTARSRYQVDRRNMCSD